MPGSYVFQPNDTLQGVAKKFNVSLAELKKLNPQLASRDPPYRARSGDVIKLPQPQKSGDVRKTRETCCVTYHLAKRPFLVMVVRDPHIAPRLSVPVRDDILKGAPLTFGQDITHSAGRPAPEGKGAGKTEADVRTVMKGLLNEFASGDRSGMAKRLFDAFLAKNREVKVFTDPALDRAAAAHPNITDFCKLTLAAPGTKGANPDKFRIHQALRKAGWDINKVTLLSGDGVPAFNRGSKLFGTEDFGNGLGLMINGVQYVYIYVEAYSYDSCKRRYVISLKFAFYDVFGLDDDDLREYGDSLFDLLWSRAGLGITAWWQLQHQFNYCPLVTRAVVHTTYTIPTTGQ